MKFMVCVTTAGLALVGGCTAEVGGEHQSTSTYAEAVYTTYEEAAGGKIQFDVAVLADGKLSTIADRPLVETLEGVPADWIVFHAEGIQISEVARGPRNPAIDEWTNPPALTDFDDIGYPIADAAYRLLEVSATLDGTTTKHRALEACWDTLQHCVVIDPVVAQVDGYYRNHLRWVAEGWGPQELVDTYDETPDPQAATRSCKLSRYTTTSKRFYWPALYVASYNIVGWKQYENWIGSQDISLRCYINTNGNCKIAAASTSYGSSCRSSMLGWSCDCDNIDFYGYTGSTAKTAAQSKCVNTFGGAQIDVGVSGAGATFSLSWTISSGTQYTNGGSYTDSCVWM